MITFHSQYMESHKNQDPVTTNQDLTGFDGDTMGIHGQLGNPWESAESCPAMGEKNMGCPIMRPETRGFWGAQF